MAEKKSLAERLQKLGVKELVQNTRPFEDSIFIKNVFEAKTGAKSINIALSGSDLGGAIAGVTVIAGPSRHFKTMFGLIMVKAYMDLFDDAICLFYDNEGGAGLAYFKSVGIDIDRVVHIPFMTVEDIRADIAIKTNAKEEGSIKRGDHVIIFVDSLGGAASEKEVRDAEADNDKADMTRAKVIKSFFRVNTVRMRILDINMIVINHTYMEQGMYPKAIVSGGQGVMLAANEVWIIGKQQEKEDGVLAGYRFVINIEKSRRVNDKAKIPIVVRRDSGLSEYSGLYDLATELGYITTPSKGWRTRPHLDARVDSNGEIMKDAAGKVIYKMIREDDIEPIEKKFYDELLEKTDFREAIKARYLLPAGKLISNNEELTEESVPAEWLEGAEAE